MKMLLVAFLFFAPSCKAQGNQLVVGSLLHAKTLSGVAVAPDGEPLPKAAVYRIECGKGEFRGIITPVILEQVQTDANGSFALSWKDHNRACLQVMTPGFNILEVEVKYARSGGKLKLTLSLGT